jgi:phage tail tape-measure protein
MENPYQAISGGVNFLAGTASIMHDNFSKPSFIKINDKNVSFNNPYLDLTDIRSGQNEIDDYSKKMEKSPGRSALQGAGVGASSGAAIGTAVMPGLGTAIGALGGAMYGAQVGLITGLIGRDKARDKVENRQTKLDASLQSRLTNYNQAMYSSQQTQASMNRFDAINEQNYLNAINYL